MKHDAAAPARATRQFRILIDTCVWLDLAKDYHQQAQLGVLEELIELGEISLVVPRVSVDEFARNRARVIEDSSRSLSTTLKRVKEAVDKFGDPRRKRMVLRQLNDVDHRLPTLGEAAVETVGRIEKLFAQADIIETSDAMKLRAAQRAIDKRAPFHRQRNGIDDALLIETYSDIASAKATAGTRFAFVTHNTKDFSHPSASNKIPHPDIASCFSRMKALYFITLGEALRRVKPAQQPAHSLVAPEDARLQPVRRRFHLVRELEDLLPRSRQAVARRQLLEHVRPEACLELGNASQHG